MGALEWGWEEVLGWGIPEALLPGSQLPAAPATFLPWVGRRWGSVHSRQRYSGPGSSPHQPPE